MADKGIPDFMREFDMNIDYGFTPVSHKPADPKPGVDKAVIESKFEGTNIELSKVKSDVSTIKSMMNEVMQIVAEKDSVNKEIAKIWASCLNVKSMAAYGLSDKSWFQPPPSESNIRIGVDRPKTWEAPNGDHCFLKR